MLRPVHFSSLTALFLVASPFYSVAGSYQSEINASYSHFDFDSSDASYYHLAGTYYFSPVDSSQGPLAEAAFLQRASSVTLSYTRGESEHNFAPEDVGMLSSSVSEDVFTVSADFYVPNSIFFAGLSVSRGSYSVQEVGSQAGNASIEEGSSTFVSGELGLTPLDGLKISSFFYEGQSLSESWNIGARWVTEAAGFSLALDSRYQYSNVSDMVSLGADIYIDRSLSVGLTHSTLIESGGFSATGIRARKFFTENFSVQASYMDSHGDLYSLGLTYRF